VSRSSATRPAATEPARVDDGDRVAEALHQLELVAGEHDGDAVGGPFEQDLAQRVNSDGVEAGERLVEDQQVGLVGEGRGELDPLLVAEGECLDRLVHPIREPEPLQQGPRAVDGGALVEPVEPAEVGQLPQ
jgi:hypothetical protein